MRAKIHSLMEGGQEMAVDRATGHSDSGPAFIGIETTTRCNLNCIMCARRCLKDSGFKFSDMTLETFQRIMPLVKTSKLVFLSKCGEPLLSPHIMDMIRMCRPFDCKIAMASNGSLMDESACEQLVDRGLDWIELSIDGIESFARIRGFELDVFIKNVKTLNEVKRKKKRRNPAVTFTFVAMKDNLSELPAVIRLAASLEVERIFVHPARIYHYSLKGQSIYHDPDNAKRLLNASKEEAARVGVNLVVRQVSFMKDEGDLISPECYCLAPFDRIFVDRKGYLNEICCGQRRLGEYFDRFNVNHAPIEGIWNCEEYRKIRLEFLEKDPAPICKNCNFILGTYENQMNLLDVGDQTVSPIGEDGILRVSVGVCAYNEEKDIGRLLTGLLAQKTGRVVIDEIIVVSDASTDRTNEIVRQMEGAGPIRLVVLESRQGKYAAVNRFLKEARSQVLVLSSADLLLAEDTIENLCRPFLADKALGMTGAHPVPRNSADTFFGYVSHLQWALHHRLAVNKPKFGELVALRRVVTELPPTLVDEEELAALVQKKGLNLAYAPGALVYNRGPADLRDFLIQRKRIYLGHRMLKKRLGYTPATYSGFRVLRCLMKGVPPELKGRPLWLVSAVLLEAWARCAAVIEETFFNCRPSYAWAIAKSTKGLNG